MLLENISKEEEVVLPIEMDGVKLDVKTEGRVGEAKRQCYILYEIFKI
jgi:hypothetical protein